MGCGLIFHGCDIVFVKNGLDAVRQTFAEKLGFTFAKHGEGAASYLEGK